MTTTDDTDDEALRLLGDAAGHVRAVVHLRPSWTDPASLYAAAGLLDEVTCTLHAVLGYATQCCDRLASGSGLRADDLGEQNDPATLAHSATTAFDAAAHTLHTANAEVRGAHVHLSRLYLDSDDGSTT